MGAVTLEFMTLTQGCQCPHKVALTSSQWERVPIDSVVYCFFSCPYISNVPIFFIP